MNLWGEVSFLLFVLLYLQKKLWVIVNWLQLIVLSCS